MRKGKFEVRLAALAVLAFVFALFGSTTLCLLALGFFVIAEKDEWLVRQGIQALMVSLLTDIVNTVERLIEPIKSVPLIGVFFSGIFGVIDFVAIAAVIVFALIAIVRVKEEKEADLPILSTFAYWAYGKVAAVVPKPAPVVPVQQPTPQAPPAVPAQQQPVTQVPPMTPVQQPVTQAVPIQEEPTTTPEPPTGL